MPYFVLTYIVGIAGTVVLAAASGFMAKTVYLAGCVGLSVWSSRKNPWDYLLFTLWVAALTPFARRLVDMAAGWDAKNIMLAAPFLVTAPMVPAVLQRLRTVDTGAALFPGLAALCIFYGFTVTLLRGEPVPALIGVADWGVPIFYFFFVAAHRDRITELLDRLPGFVTTNMLLLGAYGVWQFVDPPIWDRLWMQGVDQGPFGLPEPFMIRVFSTMNSNGPFSCWIMVLIILSFGFTSWLMPVARFAGLLALAFTTVRTSWGGLAIAMLILAVSSGRKVIRYAIAVVLASLVVVSVVALVPKINEVISQRIATFNDLQQDGSLLEREDEASRMQTLIADNPLGVGIGALGRGTIAAGSGQILFDGAIDDGVLEIFGSLGWLVGFIYCAALMGIALQCARRARQFAFQQKVCFAAGVACLAALPLTNIVTGVTGTLMWMMFGLASSLGAEAGALAAGRQNASLSAQRLDPSPIR
jgi:O-Antigen ligase